MYLAPDFEHQTSLKRIAILTSGGETPGMNSAIRAIVRTAAKANIDVLGIHRGYCGLLQQDFIQLCAESVSRISQGGGSILRCGSCAEFYQPQIRKLAASVLRDHQIDALIVIGGRGSLTGAHFLHMESEIPVIVLPGTIDNDLPFSDDAIGFDTAVNTAVDAIDKLQDTAYSHQRLFLVEVAGSSSGFVAAQVGIAVGAEMVIVPERAVHMDEVAGELSEKHRSGDLANGMVILAEGSAEPKLIRNLASALKAKDEDPRICVLGHIQRGGAPTAHDRTLAATLGNSAVHALLGGETHCMLGVQKGAIIPVDLKSVIQGTKPLPRAVIRLVEETGR